MSNEKKDDRWPNEGLRFDQVKEAPQKSGLYAWYYQHQISKADIATLTSALAEATPEERKRLAREFLLEHVFGPYREADYNVALGGKLKPEYKGQISHLPKMSELLVTLAAEHPEELGHIKTILQRIIPFFASPIYIGVATRSLRQRLEKHCYLINQYREHGPSQPFDLEDEDHSFAFEAVCIRRLLPTDLLVYVMPLEVSDRVTKSAEYILNRINYPLCGRN